MNELIRKIALRAEEEFVDKLVTHPFYRSNVFQQPTEDSYKSNLHDQLRSGTELRRENYTSLFQIVDNTSAKLQINPQCRVFKSQSTGHENAFIAGTENDAVMGFQGGILNTIDSPSILRFIVGHEFGHLGFGHVARSAEWNVIDLERARRQLSGMPRLTPQQRDLVRLVDCREFKDVLRLAHVVLQLSELNADRAGLIAEPSLDAAIESSMVLAAGAADSYGRYRSNDYLEQGRELLALPSGERWSDADVFATHPGGPFRALALQFFFESDVFRGVTGTGPGSRSEKDWLELLPRLVPLPSSSTSVQNAFDSQQSRAESPNDAEDEAAKPSVDESPGNLSEKERAELIWICLARVTMADGRVSESEHRFVATAIRPARLAEEINASFSAMSDEEFAARERELFTRVRSAHGRVKTSIVRLLIQAAKVDRRIDDSEIATIRAIADEMGAESLAHRELMNAFGSRAESKQESSLIR